MLVPRPLRRLSLALLALALLALPTTSAADVPAVYRVCADVAWRAPTTPQQRAHLAHSARWSTGDRSDPSLLLAFPFVVGVRSGSIGTDLFNLSGMWTMTRAAARQLARCPIPGGARRNLEIRLKGWAVDRASLARDGTVTVTAHARPGRIQALHFPGYGSTSGIGGRRLVLTPTDGTICAISSLSDEVATYDSLLATGLSCAETRTLQAAYAAADDLEEPVSGFVCALGSMGYVGRRVRCADATGRTLRFGFSERDDGGDADAVDSDVADDGDSDIEDDVRR